MKVIFPLLITALWASVAIDIEGVWSPVQPAQDIQATLAQLEAPATALLAQIEAAASLDDDRELQEFKALERQPTLQHRIKQIRIALPNLPRPPTRPVCG